MDADKLLSRNKREECHPFLIFTGEGSFFGEERSASRVMRNSKGYSENARCMKGKKGKKKNLSERYA